MTDNTIRMTKYKVGLSANTLRETSKAAGTSRVSQTKLPKIIIGDLPNAPFHSCSPLPSFRNWRWYLRLKLYSKSEQWVGN